MGGNVFINPGRNGEPPVHTPRMTPAVYERVKHSALVCIRAHYVHVHSLHEAPEKTSFGDIDIYVASPTSPDPIDQIAKSLKAKRIVRNGPQTHLAIPTSNAALDDDDDHLVYAQLDIQECRPDNIEWMVFLHSYGDVGQIFGVCNYDYGFTSNPSGFHVRVVEQEVRDFKASMIHLSSDPALVMQFLHLDADVYKTGFATQTALFAWLTPCRMITLSAFKDAPLDTKERHRRDTRAMYSAFFNTWLPAAAGDASLKSPTTPNPDRTTLLHAALSFFDKEAEYTSRLPLIHAQRTADTIWPLVTTFLHSTTPLLKDKLNETVRALKRWVFFSSEGEPGIREQAEMDSARQVGFEAWLCPGEKVVLKEEAKMWILEHFEEVKALERKRIKGVREARKVAVGEGKLVKKMAGVGFRECEEIVIG